MNSTDKQTVKAALIASGIVIFAASFISLEYGLFLIIWHFLSIAPWQTWGISIGFILLILGAEINRSKNNNG